MSEKLLKMVNQQLWPQSANKGLTTQYQKVVSKVAAFNIRPPKTEFVNRINNVALSRAASMSVETQYKSITFMLGDITAGIYHRPVSLVRKYRKNT